MVVGVERLGDDDLVAVVEQTVGRDLQRFAAAGRHKDVGLAQLHADVPVIALDRGDQLRNAGGGRVGQHGRAEIVDRVIEGIRRVDIGLADIQMIDLLAGCPLLPLRTDGIYAWGIGRMQVLCWTTSYEYLLYPYFPGCPPRFVHKVSHKNFIYHTTGKP